jgi:hypothetical protein
MPHFGVYGRSTLLAKFGRATKELKNETCRGNDFPYFDSWVFRECIQPGAKCSANRTQEHKVSRIAHGLAG